MTLLLHNCHQATAIQTDRQLYTRHFPSRMPDGVPRNGAEYYPTDRGQRRPSTATDRTACDPAGHSSYHCSNLAVRDLSASLSS